ncbi:MAG: VWA domain-containing protein [Candidatus Krumholzibacteriia bacterium]
MRFAAHGWLFLLATLPLLWLLWRVGDARARRALQTLLGPRAGGHVEGERPRLRAHRRLLLLMAVGALVVALARPQWGARQVTIRERGTDLVIALDISNSMLAEDVAPSRLLQARAGLDSFLARLERGRVGLVLFAGGAFVQCPLTLDHATARLFLAQAAPDMITAQGTGIAQALATSRELLERGAGAGTTGARRAIILVSDGEDFTGGWEAEAARCKEADVAILAVPVGESRGGLIPLRDDAGRPDGYLKDAAGQVVLSRADPAVLEQLARATDGEVVPTGPAGLDVNRLVADVARLGERDLVERRIAAYAERFVWPLGLALICLVLRELPGLLPPWRRRRGAAAAGAIALALLVLPVGGARAVPAPPGLRPPGAAEADRGRALYREGRYEEALRAFTAARALNPDDPRLALDVGEALARLGRAGEAVDEFRRAAAGANGRDLRAESLYNAGTSLLAAGQTEAAAKALRQSLTLEPGREDALRNLEIALREAARQESSPGQQGEPKPGDESSPDGGAPSPQGGSPPPADGKPSSPSPSPSAGSDGTPAPPSPNAAPPAGSSGDAGGQGETPPSSSAGAAVTGGRGVPGEMTRDQALDLLRALDRDEAELRRSVEKRVKGSPGAGGKRW